MTLRTCACTLVALVGTAAMPVAPALAKRGEPTRAHAVRAHRTNRWTGRPARSGVLSSRPFSIRTS